MRSPERSVLGREVGVAGQPNPSKEKVLTALHVQEQVRPDEVWK